MKNRTMRTVKASAMALVVGAFIGCGGNHSDGEHRHSETESQQMQQDTTGHHEHEHALYQCPMDCENGKMYDEPGKCPVCKMDLEEVSVE